MPWPADITTVNVDESSVALIVESTIQRSSKIATLPSVVVQVINICENPDANMDDVNKVIDPVLGMRILKLVNSAYYGKSGQVNSIKQAIVMVGLTAVKNIAIAASLVKLARGGHVSSEFDARKLWTHSIAVATGAQMLAQRSSLVSVDEAFLAGLIHDMGIVVEMQVFHQNFSQMIQKLAANKDLTFRKSEEEALGASHEAFGAGLCKQWNFPESMQLATGFHHRPWELPDENCRLPILIHIADVLAAKLRLGYTRTVETEEVDSDLLDSVKLTAADIRAVTASLPDAMQESQRLLMDR